MATNKNSQRSAQGSPALTALVLSATILFQGQQAFSQPDNEIESVTGPSENPWLPTPPEPPPQPSEVSLDAQAEILVERVADLEAALEPNVFVRGQMFDEAGRSRLIIAPEPPPPGPSPPTAPDRSPAATTLEEAPAETFPKPRVEMFLDWVNAHLDSGRLPWQTLESAGDVDVSIIHSTTVVREKLEWLQSALEEMVANNENPGMLAERAKNDGEFDAVLESIINASLRPALVFCRNELGDTGRIAEWQNEFASGGKKKVERWSKSVCLIQYDENTDGEYWEPAGTGSYIGHSLILTNSHVLTRQLNLDDPIPANSFVQKSGSSATSWSIRPGVRLSIVFGDQNNDCNPSFEPRYRVTKVVAVIPKNGMDVALLEVENESMWQSQPLPPPLLLQLRPPEAENEFKERCVAIGFPENFSGQTVETHTVFGSIEYMGVKHASPGIVRSSENPPANVCTFEEEKPEVPFHYHDCSVLRGSSGSPILAWNTERVASLHYSGVRTGHLGQCKVSRKPHPGNRSVPIWRIAAHPELGRFFENLE